MSAFYTNVDAIALMARQYGIARLEAEDRKRPLREQMAARRAARAFEIAAAFTEMERIWKATGKAVPSLGADTGRALLEKFDLRPHQATAADRPRTTEFVVEVEEEKRG